MSIWSIISGAESSNGANVWGPETSSGQAQGLYQITTGTWQQFAQQAGVDLGTYPTPNSAPASVQQQVASVIPLNRWAPFTVSAVESALGNVDTSETVGQLASETGTGATMGTGDPSGEDYLWNGANPTTGQAASTPQAGSQIAAGGSLLDFSFLEGWFIRAVIAIMGLGMLFVGLNMFKGSDVTSAAGAVAGAATAPVRKAAHVAQKHTVR